MGFWPSGRAVASRAAHLPCCQQLGDQGSKASDQPSSCTASVCQYFPLMSHQPDQTERGQGQGCWGLCEHCGFCLYLCGQCCIAIFMYRCALCVCVHVYTCVDTYSWLVLGTWICSSLAAVGLRSLADYNCFCAGLSCTKSIPVCMLALLEPTGFKASY